MKWGEIILLWVAGLWTLLLSLVLALDAVPLTGSILIWLFVACLPVWILCGLIWATIYKRSRTRSLSSNDETSPSRIAQRLGFKMPLELASLRATTPKDVFLSVGAIVILIGLPLAGFVGIGYLVWLLIGDWANPGLAYLDWEQIDFPRVEENFKRSLLFTFLSPLFDAEWKITGWKIFAMLGSVLMMIVWAKQISFWFNKKVLRRSRCWYCGQWYKDEKAADQCCRSSPPTRAWTRGWIRGHKLLTKQDAWKYGTLFVLPSVFFWTGLAALFKIAVFSWNWLWTTAGLSCWLGYGFYKVYRQKPCAGCGVLADYGIDTAKPLCSRCYAQKGN